jgi:hypothetical protein
MIRKVTLFVSFALIATVFSWKVDGLTNAVSAENKYIGKENCRECHTKLYKSYEEVMVRGAKRDRRLPGSTDLLADLSQPAKYFSESKRTPGKSRYKTKEGQQADVAKLNGLIDWTKDYSKDSKCLSCHATGSGHGGYDPANPNPNLSGVTCEACHGPGSAYVPYMEKAAEKYQREEALKYGMNFPQGDKGKKACVDACHSAKSDCPVITAIDGYTFDYEKRRTGAHIPKNGKW